MAPTRRTLFVHCGLHKTGTTAVQEVLARRAGELRAVGLLVPRAGRVGPAHHNIARGLARDSWYDPRFGTLDDAAAEIAAFPGNAVLSSECFEHLLDRPGGFTPLIAHPALAGHRLVLLLHVRNQAEYFESIAAELLRHGEIREFGALLAPLLRHRRLGSGEWVFAFNHHASWRTAARQAETVVANFHALAAGSAVAEVLARVAPDYRPAPDDLALRANPRQDLAGALTLFYANRVRRPPGPEELAAATRVAHWLGGWPRLSAPARSALCRRFALGNARLCLGARLSPRGLLRFAAPPTAAASLERAFSFETQALIRCLARRGLAGAAADDIIAEAFAAPPGHTLALDGASPRPGTD